jgi:hypothetical protein
VFTSNAELIKLLSFDARKSQHFPCFVAGTQLDTEPCGRILLENFEISDISLQHGDGLLACVAGRSVLVGCEGEKEFPLSAGRSAQGLVSPHRRWLRRGKTRRHKVRGQIHLWGPHLKFRRSTASLPDRKLIPQEK